MIGLESPKIPTVAPAAMAWSLWVVKASMISAILESAVNMAVRKVKATPVKPRAAMIVRKTIIPVTSFIKVTIGVIIRFIWYAPIAELNISRS